MIYYAFDYLLKPYRDARFEKTIEKVIEQFNRTKNRKPDDRKINGQTERMKGSNNLIPIKNAGKIQFIETNEIEFIEASGYYIEINLAHKKHLLRQSHESHHG